MKSIVVFQNMVIILHRHANKMAFWCVLHFYLWFNFDTLLWSRRNYPPLCDLCTFMRRKGGAKNQEFHFWLFAFSVYFPRHIVHPVHIWCGYVYNNILVKFSSRHGYQRLAFLCASRGAACWQRGHGHSASFFSSTGPPYFRCSVTIRLWWWRILSLAWKLNTCISAL